MVERQEEQRPTAIDHLNELIKRKKDMIDGKIPVEEISTARDEMREHAAFIAAAPQLERATLKEPLKELGRTDTELFNYVYTEIDLAKLAIRRRRLAAGITPFKKT